MDNTKTKDTNMDKKFKNTIDRNALVTALKKWTTLADGNDGATGYVEQEIPYPRELNMVVPWESVMRDFDDAIGGRKDFDVGRILNGDAEEFNALDEWATQRADKIIELYEKVLDKANALKSAGSDESTSIFTVRITRVETYTLDVDVEAEDSAEAIANVTEREIENEFACQFGCPDDVDTRFECVKEGA